MMQDGLTGRKKVVATFAFLSYSLFLQFLHKPYMFPMECCRLRRPHSCGLTKGLRIGNLQLLEPIAPNHFGFLDGQPIVTLSLQNCLGAVHLVSRTSHEWTTLAFSLDAASSASFWCSSSPSFQITHCLLRSVYLFTESMWLVAKLACI